MAGATPENSEVKTIPPEKNTGKKPGKIRSFFKALVRSLIIIAVIIALALLSNYYLMHEFEIGERKDYPATQSARPDSKIPARLEPEVKSEEAVIIEGPAAIPVEETTKKVVQEEEKVSSTIRDEIEMLAERIDNAEQQNRDFLAYITARDLKDAINNPQEFAVELSTLKDLAGENPEISGKIELLEQATAEGMPTYETLAEDLAKVDRQVKSQPAGVREKIGNMLGDLVKVTKVRGDIPVNDYAAITKRAAIELKGGKVSAKDFDKITAEVATIGQPAEEWVKKANNLKRIETLVNELLGYTKSKLAVE